MYLFILYNNDNYDNKFIDTELHLKTHTDVGRLTVQAALSLQAHQ